MSDCRTAHAPYNFVPFSEQVILRYHSAQELPPHNRIEPELNTGEIHVTITAQTPILVATQNRNDDRETIASFCNWNGKYILPGSTVRGMARANIQILGFGTVIPGEDMQERPPYFSQGLPSRHQELASIQFPLDYPRAMLGFAGPKESYRSRISFEDFAVQGKKPAPERPVQTVPGEPHPGWYPGYVVDGKEYTEEGFRLRGYKHYWMQESISQARASSNPRVNVSYIPLPAGTVFHGKIHYKNLHEDELGLLLWALRLEKSFMGEPCYQSIGMGKPYGLGRVLVDIDEILEFDMEKLYSFEGLSTRPEKVKRGKVDCVVCSYVEAYQKYACAQLKEGTAYQSLLDHPEIRDFFFLHCVHEDIDTSYMSRWEYEDLYDPLPDAASLRAKWEEQQQAIEAEPDQSVDELLKALQNRFKKD